MAAAVLGSTWLGTIVGVALVVVALVVVACGLELGVVGTVVTGGAVDPTGRGT